MYWFATLLTHRTAMVWTWNPARTALIVNSTFDVGDDGICIKSGKDADGRNRGVACENVIVNGCTVFKGHGGFVVGSEMSGGVKNIKVSDCQFLGTDVGLRFKSARGQRWRS